ncbi:2-oxoglutarate and iron-dependent oxygenase domain-containing protein, partial [Nocardia brevicatena]|uniref:2-oxoglutarate and iron-dependent oxygenase domain-containing protein n=1 Tax=Nocardia brevicatena TaxID=37327 RepID=UPI0014616F27
MARTTVGSIPTVEPSDAVDPGVVAGEVDRACREIGFFRGGGHGISADLIDNAYAVSRSFFDQSEDAKSRCRSAESSFLGYRGVNTLHASSSNTSAPRDPEETFTVCLAPAEAGPRLDESEFFPPNTRPTDMENFRRAFESYYRAARSLAMRIGAVFAAGMITVSALVVGWFLAR